MLGRLFLIRKYSSNENPVATRELPVIPGLVWHLTHRCRQRRAFLLKFARDRDNYLYWLYEARKRFGLCALVYCELSAD